MTMRSDIVKLCETPVVGIELGVAEGVFSQQVLQHQDVAEWYAVDMWAGDRGHGEHQYQSACAKIEPFPHATVIRSKFCDVLDQFDDEYFNFIYIDGYAHTGQEGGQTLRDWWPKLKPGGVFAGDDYSTDWPLTKSAVDEFCAQHNLTVHVHTFDEHNHWSRYPSWYTIKEK